ncbi:Septum site-determining protein MinC [Candidatus Arsenophonus lipoptenae]|uniref:Probable septum site-determining protein MinC n=1 Tax=Candidatus Arsenophonus lipoptenae TaxID=634113 RepID=A0A0X9W7G7_9GAMM|nr:septum site-determining protein MinC [Candidatus Arsenophonus lipoptenae]AMA65212.1 Septum site-determining protein MinC [Candidatus Arsenophonus lipoptenae]
MTESLIELKGSNFTLTVLHIYNEDPEVIKKAIQEKIDQAPTFLKNAPIILNVNGILNVNSILSCYRIITNTGLKIVGISGCTNTKLRQLITDIGLPLLLSEDQNRKLYNKKNSNTNTTEYSKTNIITAHVRSGQRVYAANCDLIVNANVSAGAELIADGNIHIYGMMRGKVLAGASGDNNCEIYCINLQAELVSIAGQFWLSEQIPTYFTGKAARLRLTNNKLTISNII